MNSPFAALKGLREELATEEKARAEADRKARLEREKRQAVVREESELWAEAIAGAQPIGEVSTRPRKKAPAVAGPYFEPEEDEQVLRELQELVSGKRPLDFTFSDEFLEGRSQDCSKQELAKLKNGELSIQAHLDLHGLNREEAKVALVRFFDEALLRGYRCVRVISGRGLHTPGGKPVLKELLVRWLIQGRLSYNVLAFCSAKPHDGGVGAVYVLLRKFTPPR